MISNACVFVAQRVRVFNLTILTWQMRSDDDPDGLQGRAPSSGLSVEPVELEEARVMHLSTPNHVPHPKPQRQPTSLACPHCVLLRVAQVRQTAAPALNDLTLLARHSADPKPTQTAAHTCLKGRARPHYPL